MKARGGGKKHSKAMVDHSTSRVTFSLSGPLLFYIGRLSRGSLFFQALRISNADGAQPISVGSFERFLSFALLSPFFHFSSSYTHPVFFFTVPLYLYVEHYMKRITVLLHWRRRYHVYTSKHSLQSLSFSLVLLILYTSSWYHPPRHSCFRIPLNLLTWHLILCKRSMTSSQLMLQLTMLLGVSSSNVVPS